MRLLILSMPAVALVAILSVSLQHYMGGGDIEHSEAALPEATHIFTHYWAEREANRASQGFTALSSPPLRRTPIFP